MAVRKAGGLVVGVRFSVLRQQKISKKFYNHNYAKEQFV